MDNSTSPKWRTNWQEFEAWLDSLDFGNEDDNNAHVASISTKKGLYWVIVGPKKMAEKAAAVSPVSQQDVDRQMSLYALEERLRYLEARVQHLEDSCPEAGRYLRG